MPYFARVRVAVYTATISSCIRMDNDLTLWNRFTQVNLYGKRN